MISLAVVNAAAVPAFVDAVNAAGNKLTGAGASVAPTVAGARAAVLSYGRNPDPKLDFQLVDAGLLAASLNDPAQLAPVLAAVNAAVAYKVVGPGLSGGTGVSLYFPPDSSTYRTSYGNLAVTTGWNKFLNSYYANGAAAGGASRAFFGTEGTTQTTADYEFTEQGVFLTVPFRVDDPSTLTGVRIRYGVQGRRRRACADRRGHGGVHPVVRRSRGRSLGSQRARRQRWRRQRARLQEGGRRSGREPAHLHRAVRVLPGQERPVAGDDSHRQRDCRPRVREGATRVLRDQAGSDARSATTATAPSSRHRESSSTRPVRSCRSWRGSILPVRSSS